MWQGVFEREKKKIRSLLMPKSLEYRMLLLLNMNLAASTTVDTFSITVLGIVTCIVVTPDSYV